MKSKQFTLIDNKLTLYLICVLLFHSLIHCFVFLCVCVCVCVCFHIEPFNMISEHELLLQENQEFLKQMTILMVNIDRLRNHVRDYLDVLFCGSFEVSKLFGKMRHKHCRYHSINWSTRLNAKEKMIQETCFSSWLPVPHFYQKNLLHYDGYAINL